PCIDVPVGVEALGGHIEHAAVVTALRVVAHEDVEGARERLARGDDGVDRVGCAEVGTDVGELRALAELRADALAYGVEVVAAPRLCEIVFAVVLDGDAGAERGELHGDGVADAAPTGDASDEGGLAVEGESCVHGRL